MTARDDIHAAADRYGWTNASTATYYDSFLREVDSSALSAPLARVFEVTEHTALDKVYVAYDSLGRVTDATTAWPGQQSALTGAHVGSDDIVGTGKARRVLRFLADGVTVAEAVTA
jgi:hypothetical protein